MKMPVLRNLCKGAFLFLLCWSGVSSIARAEWQRTETSIAWRQGTNVLWQFNFDPQKGKPFFHPLATTNGVVLTNFKPEDHPWHYGLWFSWKYINHVNYWEEDRATGKAEGATRWKTPTVKTQTNGDATIRMELTYTNPSNHIDLTETRVLAVSRIRADGSYWIFWTSEFKAGEAGAVLDRTPMPNEPGGQVNGGYAGLGLRMASAPLEISMVCSTGAVTHFVNDRARPNAGIVACNFTEGGRDRGGIAISGGDPYANADERPWYLINSAQMRFACPAILAPKPVTLKAGERLDILYTIFVFPRAVTPKELRY